MLLPVRLLLVASLLVVESTHAFQFMKGWKLPSRDLAGKAALEKFGDKSECECVWMSGCEL